MILRPLTRRSALLAALTALAAPFLAATQCSAALVRVEVYDRADGHVLEQHRHRGKRYVVGEPGHEYSIRVRNVSSARVLAVVSVDGVNVITGENADPGQSGYVIEPDATVDIEGWRKDFERTAAFYFTDVEDAYASRTGRPGNLGVIGIASFRERAVTVMASPPYEDADRRAAKSAAAPSSAANESSAAASGRSDDRSSAMTTATRDAPLGTGHGRSEYSPARRVDFERLGERADEVLAIRYDSRDRLVARGVLPVSHRPWESPDPFPGRLGFVSDP